MVALGVAESGRKEALEKRIGSMFLRYNELFSTNATNMFFFHNITSTLNMSCLERKISRESIDFVVFFQLVNEFFILYVI